jgi:hypothetical protein
MRIQQHQRDRGIAEQTKFEEGKMRMLRIPFIRIVTGPLMLWVMCTAMLNPMDARADEVIVNVTAVVTVVDDAFCQCITTVETGDTLVGYYVYDSELTDADPDTTYGLYLGGEVPHIICFYHKNHTFSSDPSDPNLRITVENPGGQDDFTIQNYTNNVTDPFQPWLNLYLIYMLFSDATGQALTSDSLLTSAPEFAAYDYRRILIVGGDLEWSIRAEVISVGSGYPVAVEEGPPSDFWVNSYPNPFNPSATITVNLDVGAEVDLSIYDVRGRHINTLTREHLSVGPHMFKWGGKDARGVSVASGVYFAVLRAGDKKVVRRLVLLR